MNIRKRARKLFGREELSEHTVKASKVDHAVLSDVRRRAAAIEEQIQNRPQLPNGELLDQKVWERLAEDVWSEYFGYEEPALRARDKIDPAFHVNRQLADKQARDPSFPEKRAMTRGQTGESALGLLGALQSLRQSYGEELAEHGERQNEIAKHQERLDELDDELESLRHRRNDGDPMMSTEEIDEYTRQAAQEKRSVRQGLVQAMAEQAQHGGSLVDAARTAMAKAAKKAGEAIECASLIPGKGAGAGGRVSVDQMLEFANRVHDSTLLQAVLEIMGRLELSMGTVRRQQRKGGFDEMVDVELGDDLRLVLPAEKALLTHPVARLDFYRRFHERSLTQYEIWSEEELKKGPLIVAADGSGSMSGAPNVFCRGLTLASCGICNREGRNCAAIEFGSEGELREFFFPAGRPLDPSTAFDFAEHFFSGGTDINQTLVRARELIENEAPFHSADLVIITDGGDHLTAETIVLRDWLRSMGVKIHGICVGLKPTQYLVEVCDSVSSVFDFAGPNSTSNRIAIDLT